MTAPTTEARLADTLRTVARQHHRTVGECAWFSLSLDGQKLADLRELEARGLITVEVDDAPHAIDHTDPAGPVESYRVKARLAVEPAATLVLADLSRMREVIEYAVERELDVSAALIELVNAGLSHR